jgi:hypothetical protein
MEKEPVRQRGKLLKLKRKKVLHKSSLDDFESKLKLKLNFRIQNDY